MENPQDNKPDLAYSQRVVCQELRQLSGKGMCSLYEEYPFWRDPCGTLILPRALPPHRRDAVSLVLAKSEASIEGGAFTRHSSPVNSQKFHASEPYHMI